MSAIGRSCPQLVAFAVRNNATGTLYRANRDGLTDAGVDSLLRGCGLLKALGFHNTQNISLRVFEDIVRKVNAKQYALQELDVSDIPALAGSDEATSVREALKSAFPAGKFTLKLCRSMMPADAAESGAAAASESAVSAAEGGAVVAPEAAVAPVVVDSNAVANDGDAAVATPIVVGAPQASLASLAPLMMHGGGAAAAAPFAVGAPQASLASLAPLMMHDGGAAVAAPFAVGAPQDYLASLAPLMMHAGGGDAAATMHHLAALLAMLAPPPPVASVADDSAAVMNGEDTAAAAIAGPTTEL